MSRGEQTSPNVPRPAPEGGAEMPPRLREILDLLPVALALLDEQGRFQQTNRRLEAFLGRPGPELAGQTLEELANPEDRPLVNELVTAWRDPQRSEREIEISLRTKDGSVKRGQVAAAAFRGAQGEFRYGILAVHDLTDHQAMEDALQKSRLSFRALAALAPVGIFRTDAKSRCVYVSERWCEMTGISAEEARSDGWTKAFPEEARRQAVAGWQAALKNGQPFRMETAVLPGDAEVRWFLCQGLPERGPAGEVLGCIGTLTDITEQKGAEAQQLLLERRLQEAQRLESLGVLAGGVAHDFNNLLTGVLGNAAMARAQTGLPPESQHHLQQIEKAALRAAELCGQMLAYSGRGRFVVENLDLNRLIEELAPVLRSCLPPKVVLQLDLASGPVFVKGDASQLRQALMNLIINAGEAVGENRGLITVTSGLLHATPQYFAQTVFAPDLPEGDYVFVEVGDNGCGMARPMVKRIFDPFFSTKFVGRGLGLPAVLGIVRGHRGAIHVYTEEGRGSTFKLLFPSTEKEPEAPRAGPGPPADWRGTGTVLVVDDEELIRTLAGEVLAACGFKVLQAANGLEGLEVFRRAPSALRLVVLDLTMPVMGGLEVFRELRRDRPDLPVLLISGFAEQEALQGFGGRKLDGFLQKPFTPQALVAKVASILEPA